MPFLHVGSYCSSSQGIVQDLKGNFKEISSICKNTVIDQHAFILASADKNNLDLTKYRKKVLDALPKTHDSTKPSSSNKPPKEIILDKNHPDYDPDKGKDRFKNSRIIV